MGSSQIVPLGRPARNPVHIGRILRAPLRVAQSLPRVWAAVALAGVLMVSLTSRIFPNDFWWHARVGRSIAELGRVPGVDMYSYTQFGRPWANQAWLAELALYGLLRAGDVPLVLLAHALAVTAAFGLLLLVNRAVGGDLRRAALLTVAAFVASLTNLAVRPQTVSLPLFALVLYLLQRAGPASASGSEGASRGAATPRALWLLPPIFVLWANAHGAFIFGLLLVGIALLCRLVPWARRRAPFPVGMLAVAALCGAAVFITPLGIEMPGYVLGFARHPITRVRNIEFMPPTVRDATGQLFFLALLGWVVAMLRTGYRPTLEESLRLLAFGVLAVTAQRGIVWCSLVAAPTVAAALRHRAAARGGEASSRERAGKPAVNAAFLGVVGVLVVLCLPWVMPTLPLPLPQHLHNHLAQTPVEAVDALRWMRASRVFHHYAYGSYLIWQAPELPVFIDTRIELYPEEQWQEYIAISGARYDWEALLERYEVDALLLSKADQPELIRAAEGSPNWELRYEDDDAAIYTPPVEESFTCG